MIVELLLDNHLVSFSGWSQTGREGARKREIGGRKREREMGGGKKEGSGEEERDWRNEGAD